MYKEKKYYNIIPFLIFPCGFANTAHHVPQYTIIKEGKAPHIVWDGSTKQVPGDVLMNDIMPLDKETPILHPYLQHEGILFKQRY